MKKSIIIIIAILLLSSCSVTKCRYSNGFKMDLNIARKEKPEEHKAKITEKRINHNALKQVINNRDSIENFNKYLDIISISVKGNEFASFENLNIIKKVKSVKNSDYNGRNLKVNTKTRLKNQTNSRIIKKETKKSSCNSTKKADFFEDLLSDLIDFLLTVAICIVVALIAYLISITPIGVQIAILVILSIGVTLLIAYLLYELFMGVINLFIQ